jgi:hypothetical protein
MSTLYHVSPKHNRASIVEFGIQPTRSQGKKKIVWLVEDHYLAWAFCHISLKRKLPVSDLIVCLCEVDSAILVNTKWPYVKTSSFVVQPFGIMSAQDLMHRIEGQQNAEYIPF